MVKVALPILCLLSLCSLAVAQENKKPPLVYKGKGLRYWLDRAFVEKPEIDRSFASIALKTLDPKGKAVRPLCLKMLSRGNEYEKTVAANVLYRVYGEYKFSVKPLIAIAQSGKKHRGMAMIVLARIGEPAKAVIPAVGQAAAGEGDEKSDALFALEKFGPLAKEQAKVARAVAESKKVHPEDRILGGRAYWKITGEAGPLLAALEPSLSDRDLSTSVNKALEDLGEKALPLWPKAIETVPEGPTGTFRFYALEKLGAKSLPLLKGLLKDSKPERLQREAVSTLGRLTIKLRKPVPEALPCLIQSLDLKADKPRYFATVFLARTGVRGKAALSKLDELSQSKNERLAKSAAKAAKAIRKALKKG